MQLRKAHDQCITVRLTLCTAQDEPSDYSIEDLEKEGTAEWDGGHTALASQSTLHCIEGAPCVTCSQSMFICRFLRRQTTKHDTCVKPFHTGVRNYQARNIMQQMRVGNKVQLTSL